MMTLEFNFFDSVLSTLPNSILDTDDAVCMLGYLYKTNPLVFARHQPLDAALSQPWAKPVQLARAEEKLPGQRRCRAAHCFRG